MSVGKILNLASIFFSFLTAVIFWCSAQGIKGNIMSSLTSQVPDTASDMQRSTAVPCQGDCRDKH